MPENLIGKTVADVVVKSMAGRDTYKDTVTWEQTTLLFTDGTTVTYADAGGDVFDPYEYDDFDEDGEPVRVPVPTPTIEGARYIAWPDRAANYFGVWDRLHVSWYDGGGHEDAYYFAGVPMWKSQKVAERVASDLEIDYVAG